MATATPQTPDPSEKNLAKSESAHLESSQMHSATDEKESGGVASQSTNQEPRDVERGKNEPGADVPSDQQAQITQPAGEDYTVLSATQKRLIVTAASLASLFSPMATAIYCTLSKPRP